MAIDAETAICTHLHDGYIMSGRTRVGVIKLRMAPTETQDGSAPLKDTLEIRLNKSSSVSFCDPAVYYQYTAVKCCN